MLCALATGCSFSVQGPVADYRPATHGQPRCQRTAAGPAALDGLGMGLSMLAPTIAAGLLVTEGVPSGFDGEAAGWLGASAGLAVLQYFALRHQARQTARCEQAWAQYREHRIYETRRRAP